MEFRRLGKLFVSGLIAWLFVAPIAFCGVEQISEAEFRALAVELSPKVNLFRDTWAQDPKAVFYGGTTRDYLYWLKGKFREAKTRAEAEKIRDELKKRPVIDVREFIIGESDIDIVSNKSLDLTAADYGVRKIDGHGDEIFRFDTELGKNELLQGHVPVEKIRLSRTEISQPKELGDGLHELYAGKLSVKFASPKDFAQTKYAKDGINHPILLALRYLRLQGIQYFQTHGEDYPDPVKLFASFDPESRAEIEKVIESALDGKELKPYLKNSQFRSWLNGTIQKSFRSYTNPTAALEILKKFRVDALPVLYGDNQIEPIYQYVFKQYRDPEKIAANLRKYKVNEAEFFEDPAKRFSDGFFYHGTREESAFRSIVFQGTMQSEDGMGGKGLYGVAKENMQFSIDWGKSRDRLVRLPVKSTAKIVDVTQGHGQKIFLAFGKSEDEFAEAFGVDIVRYKYQTEAFVVKNSDALGRPEGVFRKVMTLPELMESAKHFTDPNELFAAIEINQISSVEAAALMDASTIPDSSFLHAYRKQSKDKAKGDYFSQILSRSKFWERNVQKLAPDLLRGSTGTFKVAVDGIGQGIIEVTPEVHEALAAGLRQQMSMSDPVGFDYLTGIIKKYKKFPGLVDVLNVIADRKSSHSPALAAIAEARLTPKERERLSPVILSHKNDFFDDWGWQKDILESYFEPNNADDLLPFLRQVLLPMKDGSERHPVLDSWRRFRINHTWDGMYPSGRMSQVTKIFHLWNRYPELLEPFLQIRPSAVKKDIILGNLAGYSIETAKPWLNNEDFMGKVIRAAFPKAKLPILTPGWSKNSGVLASILESSKRDRVMGELLFKMMIANGSWEAEIGFFKSLFPYPRSASDVFNLPNITDHKEMALEAMDYMDKYKHNQVAILSHELAKEKWVNHPEMMEKFMRMFNNGKKKNNDYIFSVLKSETWKNHPEFLEQFSLKIKDRFAKISSGDISTFFELMKMPHWQGNSAFADIKLASGKIDFQKLKSGAWRKHPEYRGFVARTAYRCGQWFSGFKE